MTTAEAIRILRSLLSEPLVLDEQQARAVEHAIAVMEGKNGT